MTEQALACVANISAILEAAGSDMSSVLRVGIFMTNLSAFKEVNAVFEKSFPTRPARSTVGVASLPLGVEIEMEVTAVVK
jgi:2-iminobutanoate/2-iminopropanoate deaminase